MGKQKAELPMVDPLYRPWMTEAARKIAAQYADGTMQRTAETWSKHSGVPLEEAAAKQIVGILLAHSLGAGEE